MKPQTWIYNCWAGQVRVGEFGYLQCIGLTEFGGDLHLTAHKDKSLPPLPPSMSISWCVLQSACQGHNPCYKWALSPEWILLLNWFCLCVAIYLETEETFINLLPARIFWVRHSWIAVPGACQDNVNKHYSLIVIYPKLEWRWVHAVCHQGRLDLISIMI